MKYERKLEEERARSVASARETAAATTTTTTTATTMTGAPALQKPATAVSESAAKSTGKAHSSEMVNIVADLESMNEKLRQEVAVKRNAIQATEEKLAAIIRSSATLPHAATRMRRGRVEKVDPAEELAKELIQSKIKISELERQLRVSARAEMQLHGTLREEEESG